MPAYSRYNLLTRPNIQTAYYTQGFAVNTFLVGTRMAPGKSLGYLIIIKPPGGGWQGPGVHEPYFGPLIPGEISTITIRVPDEELPITVDAVLASNSAEVSVDALLSKYKYHYDHIKVYSFDEVEFYD